MYLYKAPQRKGPRRRKTYAGKVDRQAIDKRRGKLCYQNGELIAREAVVWSAALKQKVKVVYVKAKAYKGHEVLVCTDTETAGGTVLCYCRLRFQIEFLIRDAKTYTRLEHSQARSEAKLYNHFNLAMLSVSVAKYQPCATLPNKEALSFSMRSVKNLLFEPIHDADYFLKLRLGHELPMNKTPLSPVPKHRYYSRLKTTEPLYLLTFLKSSIFSFQRFV